MNSHCELSYVVVDDDEDDRLLMRLALEQSQRTLPVLEFSDGQELIDYLSQDTSARPDEDMHWLVIMDVNMPRMNGLDALQTLRQDPHWAKLPVLMLSTADDDVTRQLSLEKGANGYLVKPTSMQDYGPLFDRHFAPWLAVDSSQWPDYSSQADQSL
ncbi:response regulator [Spirosoma rhododendri]|uniref:Response regulator n=1 Tax=Spirosoma rhododendri TaxID=2728024 RepID=A0A7L5DHA5_9BACT|nr:response regulator [Spirosoma rhododendri]QJD77395.1 response regulator [Spirosoma rhododendri]